MLYTRIHVVAAGMVAGLFLLGFGFSAKAQKMNVSLNAKQELNAKTPLSRAELRARIGSNTQLRNAGDQALEIALVAAVYENGKLTKGFVSDGIRLEAGQTRQPGGMLPDDDWFPDTGGANLEASGSGYWLGNLPIIGWFFGPDEDEGPEVDCAGLSRDPNAYRGCLPEDCMRLAQPYRSACLQAPYLVASAPDLTDGTTILLTPVPLKEGEGRGLQMGGVMLRMGGQ